MYELQNLRVNGQFWDVPRDGLRPPPSEPLNFVEFLEILAKPHGAHDTANMTTKSLTSLPDAANQRWRGSRSGDNRTVT